VDATARDERLGPKGNVGGQKWLENGLHGSGKTVTVAGHNLCTTLGEKWVRDREKYNPGHGREVRVVSLQGGSQEGGGGCTSEENAARLRATLRLFVGYRAKWTR